MKKKLRVVRTKTTKVTKLRVLAPLKKVGPAAGRCRTLRELLRPDAAPYSGAEVRLLASKGYAVTSRGAVRRAQ